MPPYPDIGPLVGDVLALESEGEQSTVEAEQEQAPGKLRMQHAVRPRQLRAPQQAHQDAGLSDWADPIGAYLTQINNIALLTTEQNAHLLNASRRGCPLYDGYIGPGTRLLSNSVRSYATSCTRSSGPASRPKLTWCRLICAWLYWWLNAIPAPACRCWI
jgi:hypothetical protein